LDLELNFSALNEDKKSVYPKRRDSWKFSNYDLKLVNYCGTVIKNWKTCRRSDSNWKSSNNWI